MNCLVTLVVNKSICPSVVKPSIFNCLEPIIKSTCVKLSPFVSSSLRIRAKNNVPLPLRIRAKNICLPKAFLRFRTQLCRDIIDSIDRTAYIEVLIFFYLLLLSSASSICFSNFVSNNNNKILTFFN